MEPAALDRFAADWAALRPETGATPAPVGLAVSGGPDSLALVLLAHAALPGGFRVATVDHGLRAAAADEAALVARLCAARGIDHATLRLDMGAGPGVQARARAARYAALADWASEHGLAALVTAHHADDQAETMVMRLNRGAGVRGLAGMRPIARVPGRPGLSLLRPLLGWRRTDLSHLVAAAGIVAADDPSNRDGRFERARIRAGIGAADWLDPAALARSAAHLADADAALDWATEQALAGLRETDAGALHWRPGAPRGIALRVLEAVVMRLGNTTPRGSELARWHDQLRSDAVATLAGVRGDGRGNGPGAEWIFTRAAPHRTDRDKL